MKKIKIINGKVITPTEIKEGCVIIHDGLIAGVLENDPVSEDYEIIDAKGLYVSPGFIDIHTHGGGGHDFMDGTVEAYVKAAETHLRHGTTALTPTTLAGGTAELKAAFSIYQTAKKQNRNGAAFIGLHLEGPYFSMNQKGAQDPRYIKNPEPEEYEEILSSTDDIVRWSAAPELPGALSFAQRLKDKGVLPSVAHTDAVYEQVLQAFECGFTHITHLYSGMSMAHIKNARRYAGVVESAYLIEQMTVEAIADGIHLTPSLLKLIYKCKGADKIALITDSMRAAGTSARESILGSIKNGRKIIVEDGVAMLPDRTAFAGSVATADRCVRTMTKMAGVPLTDAVKMMSLTPAGIIGVDKSKGSIEKGKDADMVLFDEDVRIRGVLLKGVPKPINSLGISN